VAAWQVTKVEQVQSRDQTGNYVAAVRTWFTVGGMGPFYVDVPVATFDQGTVSGLIDAYAAHVVAVAGLSSSQP
jgi:hypothetical protein